MSAASVITPNEPFAPRAANDNELGDTYDAPGQLIHVHDRAANKRTNYIHAGGQMIARLEKTHGQAPVARYQYTDLLGSPVAGHRDDGTLWRERYTPYGEKMLKPVELDNFVGGRQSRIFCPVDRKYPKKARKGASFTGHIDDTATGLTSAFFVKRKLHDMQARYYDPVIARFLSIDPVTFMGSGNPGYFNRYAYTMNDPINNNDPTGMFCNALNKKSQFCARSQRFANLAANPEISSRTTFLSAASVITEELGALDHFSARFVTSPDVRSNLRATSKLLEQSNTIMANAIASGQGFSGGTVAQNDAAFVRYEQGIVQGLLDGLKVTDPDTYANVVGQSNSTLNSSLGHSKQFNKVLDSVRSDLGRDIDFANKSDRIAIGDALTSAIRSDQKVTCTGSRIKRSSC